MHHRRLPRHLQLWCLQVVRLLLKGNHLSGPAFPATWLMPGALPKLTWFDMQGNSGLTGTLPASLSWPSLSEL